MRMFRNRWVPDILECNEVRSNIPIWSGRRSQTETPWRGPAVPGLLWDHGIALSGPGNFAAKVVERALIFQCRCFFGFSHEKGFGAGRYWFPTRA